MLLQASQGQSGSAHVVVLGNEKGGSGKSTIALHVAVALMKAGQRVATIDLDCRQQSFTRYISNRRAWARRTGLDLELPVHCCIKLGETMQIADNETSESQQFIEAVSAVEAMSPAATGSLSATDCRCWDRATSNWLPIASTICRSGSAFARSMVSP